MEREVERRNREAELLALTHLHPISTLDPSSFLLSPEQHTALRQAAPLTPVAAPHPSPLPSPTTRTGCPRPPLAPPTFPLVPSSPRPQTGELPSSPDLYPWRAGAGKR